MGSTGYQQEGVGVSDEFQLRLCLQEVSIGALEHVGQWPRRLSQ